jgi:hypothetical protein
MQDARRLLKEFGYDPDSTDRRRVCGLAMMALTNLESFDRAYFGGERIQSGRRRRMYASVMERLDEMQAQLQKARGEIGVDDLDRVRKTCLSMSDLMGRRNERVIVAVDRLWRYACE